MKKIIIPTSLPETNTKISQADIAAYFEDGGKAPSIKEKLILKAYEITDQTKVLYQSDELVLLYSNDEKGTFLSCFNRVQEELSLELPLEVLELDGSYHTAYCVLTAEEIGILNDVISLQIPEGGVLLVKLMK